MKKLLSFGLTSAFAFTFVGAQCGTPTGLTRTCSGSTVQMEQFRVVGSPDCSGSGAMTVSVPMAGSCSISVIEPSTIPLPTSGTFNDSAGATGYDLTKGNWTLEPPPTAMMQQMSSLNCLAGAADTQGNIPLTCNVEMCEVVGDDDEPTCTYGGTCDTELIPFVGDAAVLNPPPSSDAGGGVTTDASPGDANHPG
jgi:hypothetical protein